MSQPATIPPFSRSWKDIRQGVSPRAMSKEGRRRMVFASVKFAALCVFLFGGIWAAVEVYQTWESDPARLKEPVKAVPLRQIVFATDGVLERAWLDQTLALPASTSLMTLDLAALESRLLASGQVQSVVLRRRFADNTLMVTVQERTPVARVMVQIGEASPRMRLVARDGVVYEGVGYERTVLERLPWLDGIQLRRTVKNGFEPIEGMERVAGLLTAAQGLIPLLCADWQVVSLARLASDQEIIVRSREIPEIIFDARDAPGNFPRQLAKLAYIVESLKAHDAPPMKRVNLALGGQVPVELQDSTLLKPARSSLPKTTSQPKQRRDF
jgi:cell division protein FtsQ